MPRQRFPLMLTPQERQMLDRMAEQGGLSGASLLRLLLRQEAQKQGLLTPVARAAQGSTTNGKE